ncbi:3-hydroxybutyryl-CoA dehydrogenase [Mycolicibacterium insubricum]|uniref:3-hydroxybutyryl-CoA dehydrogenase n=1 Tax=Mycolicibacterium insubricum TaxID=444597 RepID=A0A1X0DL84_9MYCO|nr:3-hydroxyacyl-CoA dehydrogenase [Mycolicibacterium insubricum]MCB9441910.1 3-hydroxyacyl-CoA dehydrogenase [Mycolicibacterium sp.]MCV7083988.1 3-hydroxyacyl-CoA dehydrogenase [Mycolicibacterium insubricum]ORA73148.1 3-hydroxybutyryl-CoA dehydrogenase [Mycolicibacterium insubricum]BBZ68563.1 3-hydroxybutyryl-CoA dehydrogenase [Mycolicibacterium insubricum]
MSPTISSVSVLGAGVLGSQIAFQTAIKGFPVTVYDINDDALTTARSRFDKLAATYVKSVAGVDADAAKAALDRLTLTTDLAAAAQSDLVVEAVPEILDLKRETYEKLDKLAPAKTIFASNSSTLLPSDLKDFTGRPDRFLNLHFANMIWLHNTAEVMGSPDTDPKVYAEVVAFAKAIGMVPIELHKEKAGYVLNSLLVPFLRAGMELVAGGYADPGDVDETWRVGTGAPAGPCQIWDVVGMRTGYNIMAAGTDEEKQLAAWLKKNYIDQGKLGLESGEGFYKYT